MLYVRLLLRGLWKLKHLSVPLRRYPPSPSVWHPTHPRDSIQFWARCRFKISPRRGCLIVGSCPLPPSLPHTHTAFLSSRTAPAALWPRFLFNSALLYIQSSFNSHFHSSWFCWMSMSPSFSCYFFYPGWSHWLKNGCGTKLHQTGMMYGFGLGDTICNVDLGVNTWSEVNIPAPGGANGPLWVTWFPRT